jgi:hypothetical protein
MKTWVEKNKPFGTVQSLNFPPNGICLCLIKHVYFQQRLPLDICFENGIVSYSIFNVKHCKERKKQKDFFVYTL